ncbi:uncharacterized protein BP5553_10633 [Venustampulla echinocandica]|uniref:Uncharacterized protein n=1 Tax=Venustampulla echinocandica TaxID=2656787 RepID=A0A370T949_9HELO|nr:uncharacterized protein BP5553_10633 [Venustampulla echinocandica]RDL30006.1 hypothetical protein BP5553_10633 [Venustampulla echinocandica]
MSDADRWPADLAVVAMQVSLRDIVVLGLMTGIDIMNVDNGARILEVTGPAGFITSSEQPLLGLLICFSAFLEPPDPSIKYSEVRQYTFEQRDYHKRLVENWRTVERRGIRYIKEANDTKGPVRLVFEDIRGMKHEVSIDDCTTWDDMIKALDEAAIAQSSIIVIGPEGRKVAPKSWEKLIKVVRRGHLKVVVKVGNSYLLVTQLTFYVY